MKSKYDDEKFFDEYSKMDRSVRGLEGAGEWTTFERMLPTLEGKVLLDLGCGFGWHCKYAVEKKAREVIGIDVSEKMLAKAKLINKDSSIKYINSTIEEIEIRNGYFDVVISSLALHYVEDFQKVCEKVYGLLKEEGEFIFSVEHPIFTAYGNQEWYCDDSGEKLHWPVDNYFEEGKRISNFLGEDVVKYHKTLTTYINGLLKSNFTIKEVIEPIPPKEMLEKIEGMKDELRRPMMLLISAKK
ncbi:MAG: class I SAM-dependent methyltransferase [Sarcina sp.]